MRKINLRSLCFKVFALSLLIGWLGFLSLAPAVSASDPVAPEGNSCMKQYNDCVRDV